MLNQIYKINTKNNKISYHSPSILQQADRTGAVLFRFRRLYVAMFRYQLLKHIPRRLIHFDLNTKRSNGTEKKIARNVLFKLLKFLKNKNKNNSLMAIKYKSQNLLRNSQ
jgi:hypothetical protein